MILCHGSQSKLRHLLIFDEYYYSVFAPPDKSDAKETHVLLSDLKRMPGKHRGYSLRLSYTESKKANWGRKTK